MKRIYVRVKNKELDEIYGLIENHLSKTAGIDGKYHDGVRDAFFVVIQTIEQMKNKKTIVEIKEIWEALITSEGKVALGELGLNFGTRMDGGKK